MGILICVLFLWNVIQNAQIKCLRGKPRVPSMQELADVHAVFKCIEVRVNTLEKKATAIRFQVDNEVERLDEDDDYNVTLFKRVLEKLFLSNFNMDSAKLRELINQLEKEVDDELEEEEKAEEIEEPTGDFAGLIDPKLLELMKTLKVTETEGPQHVAILIGKGVRPSSEAITTAYAIAAHMGIDDIQIIEA